MDVDVVGILLVMVANLQEENFLRQRLSAEVEALQTRIRLIVTGWKFYSSIKLSLASESFQKNGHNFYFLGKLIHFVISFLVKTFDLSEI